MLGNNHLSIQNFDQFLLSITTIPTTKVGVVVDILQGFVFVMSLLDEVILIGVRIVVIKVRVVRVRVRV